MSDFCWAFDRNGGISYIKKWSTSQEPWWRHKEGWGMCVGVGGRGPTTLDSPLSSVFLYLITLGYCLHTKCWLAWIATLKYVRANLLQWAWEQYQACLWCLISGWCMWAGLVKWGILESGPWWEHLCIHTLVFPKYCIVSFSASLKVEGSLQSQTVNVDLVAPHP